MKKNDAVSFDALERTFHEPGRLAIMSMLCAAEKGLTFPDLRNACSLTDGNLNRHLKVLEEAGAVKLEKSFVGVKPRTLARVTRRGLDQFQSYLRALEDVLKTAQRAVAPERASAWAALARKNTA